MEKYTYKELIKDSWVKNQENINKLKKVLSEKDQKELDNYIKNKISKKEQNKLSTKNIQREQRLNLMNLIQWVKWEKTSDVLSRSEDIVKIIEKQNEWNNFRNLAFKKLWIV